jgi:hypothetical protein
MVSQCSVVELTVFEDVASKVLALATRSPAPGRPQVSRSTACLVTRTTAAYQRPYRLRHTYSYESACGELGRSLAATDTWLLSSRWYVQLEAR